MVAILDYFKWLCQKIAIPDPGEYGYKQLFSRMMVYRFKALLEEDERRIEDVLYLRRSFARTVKGLDENQRRDFYTALGPCSVFEILVILADKMSFELSGNRLADTNPAALFFELIDNLELGYLKDEAFEEDLETSVDELEGILSVFVNRDYGVNGYGSVFPLEKPSTDVSKIGLIQQMDLYLIEKYDLLE